MSVEISKGYAPIPLRDPRLPEEVDFVILHGLRDRIVDDVSERGLELNENGYHSYHLGDESFSVKVVCHDDLKMMLRASTDIEGRHKYIGYRSDLDAWNFLTVDEEGHGTFEEDRVLQDSGQIYEQELDIYQISEINLALARFSKMFLKGK